MNQHAIPWDFVLLLLLATGCIALLLLARLAWTKWNYKKATKPGRKPHQHPPHQHRRGVSGSHNSRKQRGGEF